MAASPCSWRSRATSLDALAKALNVPVSQLFAESEERRDCSFVKAGTGVRIERRGTKAGHQFDAAARHGPEELIEAPMQYLSIIIYPRRN